MSDSTDGSPLSQRIHAEIVDSFDEELEMEIDDERLARLLGELAERPEQETIDRRIYFKELFRLQGELVKLQDWVADNKLKVVVIFEGRDAAGKGGVIKRITQRLNPRVCRVAALPTPTAKEAMLERTHVPGAPWWIVEADDKKKARLNCIHHLLGQFPYEEMPRQPVTLPERVHNPNYLRGPVPKNMYVPGVY
jgi:polyphosphate kinase 2 (PPK2 family)